MGMLEYLNHTVPDLILKDVKTFWNRDPFFEKVHAANKVQRQGGSEVRITRVKSDHSTISEIDGSNIEIDISKKDTTDYMKGDWGRLIKPVIVPKADINRTMQSADKKRLVTIYKDAAMATFMIKIARRMYVGDQGPFVIGTLNGEKTNGTSTGFSHGFLEAVVPASQNNPYMGLSRTVDAQDFGSWYNQYGQITGIGTDFLQKFDTVVSEANSYAEEGEVDFVVVSLNDKVKINQEVRSFSLNATSATPVLQYTAADLQSGRAHVPFHKIGGAEFFANRHMNNTSGLGRTEVAYLLNSKYFEVWVNAGCDFKCGKFTDRSETSNQDALVAMIELEMQFAATNLLPHGVIAKSA